MSTDTTRSSVYAAAERRADRSGRQRRIGTVAVYVVLVSFAVIYIYPFLVQVATSFKPESEAVAEPLGLIPQTWSSAAYQELFLRSDFPLWFRNSTIVTIVVTLGRVFINSLAGYALARLEFRGRSLVFAGVVAVMAVPGVVLLIPKFLVLNQIGIYNSFAGMIIPLMADAAGIFIMKNFFESIPKSVEEAARIDGAGPFRTYWSIVLPMATPALVTLVILSFQGSWNELSHFIVAAQDPELRTLTKGVAQLAAGGLGQGSQFPLKLGAAAIMTIPVAVLFFVFQRRIMNVTSGAVKE
ncbi:carbohydrate ABC transporter permease [Georgenia sp. M64]|uniref:carbohydrate ABC transporter permease n=1 Tax=Georgenia sp. M64 TaxID=3120520 RepID=UPI0030E4A5E9